VRDLSRGDRGKEVLDVQTRLRGQGFEVGREGVDGFYGPHTETAVLSFQQERGLLADGRVGANTWREMVESGYALGDRLLYLREPPFRGDDVLQLQVKLNLLGFNAGPERGMHDEEVERAVLDFQRNAGLPPDGIVGGSTLKKLEAVRKAESGREGKKIPERDRGYAAARGLTGQSVTIDPGHGGVDTGALGRDHAVEKFLVLEFAKVLGAKLREGDHFRVVFTREDDSFVPLRERVKLARRLGAGLFVSLHADALGGDGAGVQGATVYTVSDRASDAEAARVAEHENKADAAAGVEAKEDASDVNDILFDLTRRETRAYSHVFSHSLAEYWKVAARLNKNPSRSAGFVVLKAPDVPSVLLELGYLSNDADAADLSSPEWRQKAASQVARAIEGFFAAHPSESPPKAPNGAALKATQSNGN